jgi:hypothetical protein
MRSTRAVPLLLAFAAGLHLAVMPSHVEEGLLVGGFFLAVAVAQLVSAVLVHRGVGPLTRFVIAAGNLGVVAVWLVSRTVGLSLGGHDSAPEPIALLDSLSVIAQLAAVVGLYLRTARSPRRRGPARLAGLPALPALALVALLAGGAGLPFAEAAHAHEHADAHHAAPASVDGHTHSHANGAEHHHDHEINGAG